MPFDELQLPPSDAILSVSAYTRKVKQVLETSIRPGWVRGEISNFRRQASGHLYFSLKDEGSQLPAVMFRGNASGLTIDLRDGMQVLAYGEISVYEPRGSYQLIVRAVIEDGVGRLQREFERLKQRLAAEGLFDRERKQEIPRLPSTVGIITSPTGAAVQDFIRILKRRGWRGRVVVLPVKVQGDGAASEMVSALVEAEALGIFDLLVIGRGGGSIEDLWAFNEEPLVRAVARCPIPIVSAVGHEIDFTLCDFAADARAETPSGAAELISSYFVECADRARGAEEALDDLIESRIREFRHELSMLDSRLRLVSPAAKIEHAFLRVDDLSNRLYARLRDALNARGERVHRLARRFASFSPEHRVTLAGEKFKSVRRRYERAMEIALQRKWLSFHELEKRLAPLGPESTLRRGFVIVRDLEGSPVERRKGLNAGEKLVAEFADGSVGVRVDGSASEERSQES